jgi:hypothetical protein
VSVRDEQFNVLIEAESFDLTPPTPDRPVGGTLRRPKFTFLGPGGKVLVRFLAASAEFATDSGSELQGRRLVLRDGKLFFPSDLTIANIQLRQSSDWLDFMSIRQLSQLAELKQVADLRRAVLTKHIRITEPLNNLVMLLVGVPFILSRERNVKSSAMRCLCVVGVFYAFIYMSRYLDLPPVWAAWLPVLIFGPIAAIMYDSIRT